MAGILIHNEKITDPEAFLRLCPFQALELTGGKISVNAACKICKLCVAGGPEGAAECIDGAPPAYDTASWRGLAVYVDHDGGRIHPVTYELIGKARALAQKIGHPVYALCIGAGMAEKCGDLLHYGVDAVYAYDDPALARFRVEPYSAVFHDFALQIKPSAILVGATPLGRQLAPRAAARLRTGLTADCTFLDIHENTNLVQIRPAFGGNIMAEIVTPRHRPQMATVRYKVMEAPPRGDKPCGSIVRCAVRQELLSGWGRTEVLEAIPRAPEKSIEAAEILVVAGRGVKRREDLAMLQELAGLLGGQLACTRPLAESGWMDAKRQIGLSGRTVRPKLIITCGVSGAIQFVAGMNASETIIAINIDEDAPVMRAAHIAVVGDLYDIIPPLLSRIKEAPGGHAYGL